MVGDIISIFSDPAPVLRLANVTGYNNGICTASSMFGAYWNDTIAAGAAGNIAVPIGTTILVAKSDDNDQVWDFIGTTGMSTPGI